LQVANELGDPLAAGGQVRSVSVDLMRQTRIQVLSLELVDLVFGDRDGIKARGGQIAKGGAGAFEEEVDGLVLLVGSPRGVGG